MSHEPDDHAVAVQQIGELLDRHRYPHAQQRLSEVLPQFPDSLLLRHYQAFLDWVQGSSDDAVAGLEAVLADAPDWYDARLLLARVRLDQDQYPEAEQVLLALLHDHPEDAQLYATYAEVMMRTMNFDKAERLAAEALRREPNDEQAMNVHVLSGFINSTSEEQRARLQQLLREHPDQAQTTIRLIQHLLEQGRHREAYELSRELVVADPSNETLVEATMELRRVNHWSMKPLWPLQRFGWAGSIAIWFGAVLLFRSGVLDEQPALAGIAAGVFLTYVVYSWVWPSILKRLLR